MAWCSLPRALAPATGKLPLRGGPMSPQASGLAVCQARGECLAVVDREPVSGPQNAPKGEQNHGQEGPQRSGHA